MLAQIGLVVGVLLIGYAIYLFWHRSQTDSAVVGKLQTRFQSARPWEFVVLGLGLNLRPKAILLAVAAGAVISVREPPLFLGAVLVLAYAVVTQSAVVVPIAVWLRSPERAEVPLTAIYAWMQRNGRTIAAVATLTIGVLIVGYAVSQL